MAKPFVIASKERTELDPAGPARAFVDTTGEEWRRDGIDVDLSHWYPNRTPAEFRADTSTEIALRFAARHPDHDFLVVNDHGDTDGVLGVFVLVHPDVAVAHREAIAAAAEIGDFSFAGSRDGQVLYAALTERRLAARASGLDLTALFADCVDYVVALLEGEATASPASVAAVDALARSVDLIADGAVDRRVVTPHLVHYVVRGAVAQRTARLAEIEPRFDQPLTDEVWLSHRARNAFDRETLQILSLELDSGWKHSIWVPQYVPWDTETLWRPSGWQYAGERLTWQFTDPVLADAIDVVHGKEAGGARWTTHDVVAPWTPGFPVLAESDASSTLDPDIVADAFTALAS